MGAGFFLNLKQNMNYRGANPFQMQFPGFPTPSYKHTAHAHTHSAKSIILIYGIKAPHWDLLSEAHIAALFLILLR